MRNPNFHQTTFLAFLCCLVLQFFSDPALGASICSDESFPQQPIEPIWSRSIENNRETALMEVWRNPCSDTEADLFITITPNGDEYDLCEADFGAVQNGETFDMNFAEDPSDPSTVCHFIEEKTTVFVHIPGYAAWWDRQAAFRLRYKPAFEPDNVQILDIEAYGDTADEPTNLHMETSGLPMPWFDDFRRGDFTIAALPNQFTMPSVVPRGCLTVAPDKYDLPPDFPEVDSTTSVEDAGGEFVQLRVRIWRLGCHEPDRSALLVNIKTQSEDRSPVINLPTISLFRDGSSRAEPALMSELGAESISTIGASEGRSMTNSSMLIEGSPFNIGRTFVVDALQKDISADDYNERLTLRFDWGKNQLSEFNIAAFHLSFDSPQLEAPALHGRYSGQWTSEELPRSGLVLQVGEVAPDRNFVFAIWFTYVNGNPIWYVANADIGIGSSEIVLDLLELDGGQVMTRPGSFTADDVNASVVGSMTLRAIHCNALEADVDLREIGLGHQIIELRRLIRIAGYDCDQTQ